MFKNFICLVLFFSTMVFANENITNLLNDFAQKADLSNQTKQESAGFLIIYTRQDLDRMKVHYLKDIIDQIPFIRYNENEGGLTNPFYVPYQPTPESALRVYINDRELISPYGGSALKLFGQMNMDFIDHVEVYFGPPSLNLGIQPASIIIKCYTKDPAREQTTSIKAEVGSYGTKDISVYTAKSLKNYSYLIYANSRELNKPKTYYNNNQLSKNQDTNDFYMQFSKGNIRFELQAAKGSFDTFMGKDIGIDPQTTYKNYKSIYSGIYYYNKDLDIKGFINYTEITHNHYDLSNTIVGIVDGISYNNVHIKIKEQTGDAQLYKVFKKGKSKIIAGFQGRYKNFKIEDYRLGDIVLKNTTGYNTELILSSFMQYDYQFNPSNIFTSSIKYDKTLENGNIDNYDTSFIRVGYIYHNQKWTSKTFIFKGEFIPSMKTLFENSEFFHQTSHLSKNKDFTFGTRLSYSFTNDKLSLFLGKAYIKNYYYFDGTGYKRSDNGFVYDSISVRNTYNFDPSNRVVINGWANAVINPDIPPYSTQMLYGGLIAFYNSFGKFYFYNDLIYKHWIGIEHDGWNVNSTITYRYSRKLSFFVKGENIFDKALKSDYLRINYLDGTIEKLDNVDSIERRFWLGLEYQF